LLTRLRRSIAEQVADAVDRPRPAGLRLLARLWSRQLAQQIIDAATGTTCRCSWSRLTEASSEFAQQVAQAASTSLLRGLPGTAYEVLEQASGIEHGGGSFCEWSNPPVM
jgi:hypothetical protein